MVTIQSWGLGAQCGMELLDPSPSLSPHQGLSPIRPSPWKRTPGTATLLTYYMWTVSGINQHLVVSVSFAFHLLRAVAGRVLCSMGPEEKPKINLRNGSGACPSSLPPPHLNRPVPEPKGLSSSWADVQHALARRSPVRSKQ